VKARRIRPGERGAALLAVLLLVALVGAIAAAVLEKVSLSRAAATNAAELDVARGYADGVERLALVTIDDLIVRDARRTTLAGGWNGRERAIPLPGGGLARVRVADGGNCFNLNSVVSGDPRTRLVRRATGVAEFVALMTTLDVPEGDARRIAEAAADWADSDAIPGPGGAEDEAYRAGPAPYRTGNTLFADVGELALVSGMTPEIMARLRPWLCVLPTADLAPVNVNTLLPGQAPLLAMLAPGQLDLGRAQAVIASRPPDGWESQVDFWQQGALRGLAVPLDLQMQAQLKTTWFALDVRVTVGEAEFHETALVDARRRPSRLATRRWEE
jgi:general secretion pathway protein K